MIRSKSLGSPVAGPFGKSAFAELLCLLLGSWTGAIALSGEALPALSELHGHDLRKSAAALLIFALAAGTSQLRKITIALLVGLLSGSSSVLIEEALAGRAFNLPGVAPLLATLFSGTFEFAGFEGHTLYVSNGQGVAGVLARSNNLPIWAILALGAWAFGGLHIARGRPWVAALTVVAAAFAMVLVSSAWTALEFLSSSKTFARDFPLAPGLYSISLYPGLVAGFASGGILLSCFEKRSPEGRVIGILGIAAGLLVVALGGHAFRLVYASSSTPNAILVDDRLAGTWGPTARQLDFDWFGDFSTYGLSAAVEMLSYDSFVAVNQSQEYSRELLANFDVVVFRTPVTDLSKPEYGAVLEFVRGGGGLVLVGDHTNLMGSSSRLNEFAELAGIHFTSDAVFSGVNGAFSLSAPSRLASPAGSHRLPPVLHMTGCSIQLSGGAIPMHTARFQGTEPKDWSGFSYFGKRAGDLAAPQGTVALAAVGSLGRGRVVGCSDSTLFSSFAIYRDGREELWRELIARSNGPGWLSGLWLTSCLGVVGLGLLLVALSALRSGRPGPALLQLSVAGLPWVASATAFSFSPEAALEVEPVNRVPRAVVWSSDCNFALGPVLGASGVPEDLSYETLYAAIPRTGVYPRLSTKRLDPESDRAIIAINPVVAPSGDQAAEIREYLRSGASLVLFVDSRRYWPEAVNGWLALAEIAPLYAADGSFQPGAYGGLPVPSPLLSAVQWGTDSGGSVVHCIGAEWLTASQLGHAFALPSADQHALFRSLERVFTSANVRVEDRNTVLVLEQAASSGPPSSL